MGIVDSRVDDADTDRRFRLEDREPDLERLCPIPIVLTNKNTAPNKSSQAKKIIHLRFQL